MKAIIKFKLPEEQSEFDMFSQASKMYNTLWEMQEWLKRQIKYAPDDTSKDTYIAYEKSRDMLKDLLNENNIDLDK